MKPSVLMFYFNKGVPIHGFKYPFLKALVFGDSWSGGQGGRNFFPPKNHLVGNNFQVKSGAVTGTCVKKPATQSESACSFFKWAKKVVDYCRSLCFRLWGEYKGMMKKIKCLL